MASEARAPISPGQPAPDFQLPLANEAGTVSLADYRGKTPVLLAMMRGLYCAFCRRHIAQLSSTRQKLKAFGVETLAIVAMPAERVRLYYQYGPWPCRLQPIRSWLLIVLMACRSPR
jgi:AhpC/TSA family